MDYFMDGFKAIILYLNGFIVQFCQLLAIIVILCGVVKAMMAFVKDLFLGESSALAIQESRMELGHTFSLGLGFLIGGSILHTTLAPSWQEIGQLASIIAIRTVLNYFLMKEIERHDNKVEMTVEKIKKFQEDERAHREKYGEKKAEEASESK